MPMRLRQFTGVLLLTLLATTAFAAPRERLDPRTPEKPNIIRKVKKLLQSLGDVSISPPRP